MTVLSLCVQLRLDLGTYGHDSVSVKIFGVLLMSLLEQGGELLLCVKSVRVNRVSQALFERVLSRRLKFDKDILHVAN